MTANQEVRAPGESTTSYRGDGSRSGRRRKRGTGWIVLAGILLGLAGLGLINNGAWALHANDAIATGVRGTLLFSDKNLDVWGWIYIVTGAVVVVTAIAVLFRARWAVWVGIIVGMASVAIQFLWIFTPYWPSALVTIALDAAVVCILSKYGIEGEDALM